MPLYSRLLSLIPNQLSKQQKALIRLNSGPIEALDKYLNNLEIEALIRDRELAMDLELSLVAGRSFSILTEAFAFDNLSVQRITADSHDPSVLEFIAFKDRARPLKRLEDVHKRITGPDSRCYGLFNPLLRHPVSFVYLKLFKGLASTLSDLLETSSSSSHDSCIFYSISSPVRGLNGIEFAGRLIKSVMRIVAAEETADKSDRPSIIKIFATFSPIPNFRAWLMKQSPQLANLSREQVDEHRDELFEACRSYLDTKTDPVTKFHLRNGAAIGPIRFRGDFDGEKSFQQSYGIQVNYIYSI